MKIKDKRAVSKQKIMILAIVAAIIIVLFGSVLFGSIKARAASKDSSYKYYTSIRIEQGDTLWSIADTYRTAEYADTRSYIREICAINHIAKDSMIHSGQYLMIPYYSDTFLE